MEFVTDAWIARFTCMPMLITKPDDNGVLRIAGPDRLCRVILEKIITQDIIT